MSTCHDKVVYDSEMLARNMVALHKIVRPDCRSFAYYPHGDHFHVGHHSRAAGDKCKALGPLHHRDRRPH